MISALHDIIYHMWTATPLEFAMIAGIFAAALAYRAVDGIR